MIDFHSHVLPGIDDGSSSVEESMALLRLSRRQGVTEIVASPHFYATKEKPAEFLRKRDLAWDKIYPNLGKGTPKIHLGAEVYYFSGISEMEELPLFCIGRSNVVLLEMPFKAWTERMVDEVIALAQDRDITIVLAHIDRYINTQDPDTWDILEDNNIFFQVNASAFLGDRKTQKKMYRFFEDNRIAVMGSDCHNMKDRLPNMAAACNAIDKKFGEGAAACLTDQAKTMLQRHVEEFKVDIDIGEFFI